MKGGSRRTLCECGKCFGSDLNSWAQKNLSWQTPAWYGFCNKKSKEFIRRVYCKIPSTWLLLKKKDYNCSILTSYHVHTKKDYLCQSHNIFWQNLNIQRVMWHCFIKSMVQYIRFWQACFFLQLLSLVFDSTYKAAGFWLSLSDPYPSTFPTWEFLTVARLP